jgi:hypothetical protein
MKNKRVPVLNAASHPSLQKENSAIHFFLFEARVQFLVDG